MSQWVQHKSGQGEKWEVVDMRGMGQPDIWETVRKCPIGGAYWLPTSEFVLCDPPEQWVDVTGDCDVPVFQKPYPGYAQVWHGVNLLFGVGDELVSGYRIRKVRVDLSVPSPTWAIIIEKKVQP